MFAKLHIPKPSFMWCRRMKIIPHFLLRCPERIMLASQNATCAWNCLTHPAHLSGRKLQIRNLQTNEQCHNLVQGIMKQQYASAMCFSTIEAESVPGLAYVCGGPSAARQCRQFAQCMQSAPGISPLWQDYHFRPALSWLTWEPARSLLVPCALNLNHWVFSCKKGSMRPCPPPIILWG